MVVFIPVMPALYVCCGVREGKQEEGQDLLTAMLVLGSGRQLLYKE